MLENRPTAICAANDLEAIGAIKAIREAGLSVPDDISVTGYNNIWIAPKLIVGLTTMDTPLAEMGEKAFSMLMEYIGGNKPASVTLETKLIMRGSTTAPRQT